MIHLLFFVTKFNIAYYGRIYLFVTGCKISKPYGYNKIKQHWRRGEVHPSREFRKFEAVCCSQNTVKSIKIQ